jgi:hypothetical protein
MYLQADKEDQEGDKRDESTIDAQPWIDMKHNA